MDEPRDSQGCLDRALKNDRCALCKEVVKTLYYVALICFVVLLNGSLLKLLSCLKQEHPGLPIPHPPRLPPHSAQRAADSPLVQQPKACSVQMLPFPAISAVEICWPPLAYLPPSIYLHAKGSIALRLVGSHSARFLSWLRFCPPTDPTSLQSCAQSFPFPSRGPMCPVFIPHTRQTWLCLHSNATLSYAILGSIRLSAVEYAAVAEAILNGTAAVKVET